ncbi:hypothetical protein [Frankia canadensis]|nr:hypothetical protein [Frankia canadensis]
MTHFVDRLRSTPTARWYEQLAEQRRRRSSLARVPAYDQFEAMLRRRLAGSGGDVTALARTRFTQAQLLEETEVPRSSLHHMFHADKPPCLVYRKVPHSDDAGKPAEERGQGALSAMRISTAQGIWAAEVKVWTYWPCRDGWLEVLAGLDDPVRRTAAESLVLMVAEWASRNRAVAACHGFAPPLAAVEDLLVVSRSQLNPSDAVELLTTVTRRALQDHGRGPADLLNVVHDSLMGLAFDAGDGLTHAMGDLVASVSTLARLVPTIPPPRRALLADELGPTFADLMELLCPPTR